MRPNGTISAQSGGITAVKTGTTGTYRVDFGSDVSHLMLVAVGGIVSDAGFRGSTTVGSCAAPVGDPTLIGCNTGTAVNNVFVGTLSTAGALQDHGFYLAVMGPVGVASGPMGPAKQLHGGFAK